MDTPQVSKLKKVGLACLLACVASAASANDRDRPSASTIASRACRPAEATLDEMEALVRGDPIGAANIATQNPSFYNVTLKNMAVPWTNRDQTVFAPLNDYVATFIGMVRDDVPFNTALSADLTYTVQGVTPAASRLEQRSLRQRREQRGQPVDGAAADDAVLDPGHSGRARPPASSPRAPPSEAFFIDGTNRAMFRFTMMNHMCRDMEQVHDTSLPPDMIRQDVSRSPGGDSRIFLNNCIGCHSGMDPLARAFAYYDFDNGTAEAPGTMRLVYTPDVVQPKYFNNDTNFAPGFRHARRPLGEPLAPGPELAARLGPGAAGPGRGRQVAWARSSPTATPSRTARSKRYSRPCASARPGNAGRSRRGRRVRPTTSRATATG